MANNNLGKYLHPRKSEMPGESDRKGGAALDKKFAQHPKAAADAAAPGPPDPQEPAKTPAPRTKTNTPLTAEERFYKSATPAPLKGLR